VAALDRLPPTCASVVALPTKIKGGSGGPLRIRGLGAEIEPGSTPSVSVNWAHSRRSIIGEWTQNPWGAAEVHGR